MVADSEFDEVEYLNVNLDVKAAVDAGIISSGYEHYMQYGRFEGRTLRYSDTRQYKIFKLIDKYGAGLEIGSSYNPLAPKKQGFNVKTVDHADAKTLREKYLGHNVNIDNIEEVDFVSHGEPLSVLTGGTNNFDWVIASHVIEHIPDLISFLQECELILKPKGVLSLVVPDKRYCFDWFGALTQTGDVLDAWHQKRVRPSHGQIFDYFMNICKRDHYVAWWKGFVNPLSLFHNFQEAYEKWSQSQSSADYIDVHCWRFIPESFDLMLSDLRLLGLTTLEVGYQHSTVGCEFYVSLVKPEIQNDDIKALPRLEWLEKISQIERDL